MMELTQGKLEELRVLEPTAWLEYTQDQSACFLAYSHNAQAKSVPLYAIDLAPLLAELTRRGERIAELEADNEAYMNDLAGCRDAFPFDGVFTNELAGACSHPGEVVGYVRQQVEQIVAQRDAARLQGFEAARERAASIASNCLWRSPAPTIRAMRPPAEWLTPEAAPGVTAEAPGIADWPHPDGFAGGLTEREAAQ